MTSWSATSPKGRPPEKPESLYPRHFGVTFRDAADFEALHELAVIRKIPFFAESRPGSMAMV